MRFFSRLWSWAYVGVLALLLLGTFRQPSWLAASPPQADSLKIQMGPQEDVLKPHAFGLTDFPDGLVGVVKRNGTYYWFVGAFAPHDRTKTYLFRFISSNLNSLMVDPMDSKGNAVPVLSPGPPGTHDDHIAGNGSVYFDAGRGRLYFWYQAMRSIPESTAARKAARIGADNVYPAYGAIGLAVSDDLGRSWRKLGVALRLNITWEKFLNDDSIGLADSHPPAVVRNGEFLYMYYQDYQPPAYAPWNFALARLPLDRLHETPQPWRKYFQGSFSEPSTGGRFSRISEGVLEFPTVSFNSYLKQWIMLHLFWDERPGWKFALRTSPNGIRWSKPRPILTSSAKDYYMHPTIVGSGNNPSESGQEFWVYYCYAPNERADPGCWMVRRRVAFN